MGANGGGLAASRERFASVYGRSTGLIYVRRNVEQDCTAYYAESQARSGGCEMTASDYSSAMILEKFPEVQRLSASEKLIFVSELWNDLEAHPSEVPVSREIIAELDRRMEHFRQHPDDFTTWEAVKGRILGPQP
jgi:putative addiction module component (TIGR02574 family)